MIFSHFDVSYSDFCLFVRVLFIVSPLTLSAAQKMNVCVEEEKERAESPGFNCVSTKSDRSMGHPLVFTIQPARPSRTE